jgi:hypothetical protein
LVPSPALYVGVAGYVSWVVAIRTGAPIIYGWVHINRLIVIGRDDFNVSLRSTASKHYQKI